MIELIPLQDTAQVPHEINVVIAIGVGLIAIGLVAGFYWFLFADRIRAWLHGADAT